MKLPDWPVSPVVGPPLPVATIGAARPAPARARRAWRPSAGPAGLPSPSRGAITVLAAQDTGGLVLGRPHDLVDLQHCLIAGLKRPDKPGHGGQDVASHLGIEGRGALAHPIAALQDTLGALYRLQTSARGFRILSEILGDLLQHFIICANFGSCHKPRLLLLPSPFASRTHGVKKCKHDGGIIYPRRFILPSGPPSWNGIRRQDTSSRDVAVVANLSDFGLGLIAGVPKFPGNQG
jgi:hypothetical protein